MATCEENQKNFPAVRPDSFSDKSLICEEYVWLAAFTLTGQEIKAAAKMAVAGIPTFLPIVQRKITINGERITRTSPLFSNYIFFGDNGESAMQAAPGKIIRILHPSAQAKLIRDLKNIERALAADPGLRRLNGPSVVGRKCTVKRGPLMGCEGEIERVRDDQYRLVVKLEFLGQKGVSCERLTLDDVDLMDN